MSYTPKHAKPESIKNGEMGKDHGAFGIIQARTGRHVRTGGKAQRAVAGGRV